MPRPVLAFLALCCLASAETSASATACTPVRRTDWSVGMPALYAQRAAQGGIDLLFLGDSITMLWTRNDKAPHGQAVWDRTFGRLRAAQFGIAGDRTEHLLWRITEGRNLDGCAPKVIVLLIGTNNLHREGRADTPAETAQGVAAVVAEIRKRQPTSRLLLLGLFPRVDRRSWYQGEGRVEAVNAAIARLADWSSVFFLDIGARLLAPDGSCDRGIMHDGLHLTERGYGIWADVIGPYVADLMAGGPPGDVWQGAKAAVAADQGIR